MPTYQKICSARESKYEGVTRELAEAIIREGHYQNIDARVAAETLSSLTDVLLLSCLITPKFFSRSAAREAIMSYLRGVFPDHYREKDAP